MNKRTRLPRLNLTRTSVRALTEGLAKVAGGQIFTTNGTGSDDIQPSGCDPYSCVWMCNVTRGVGCGGIYSARC